MDIIDLLFIGGPKWVINKTGLVIRQCDFTFEGIGEAYQTISRYRIIAIVPDDKIYESMPTANDFDNINPFRSYSGLDKSLVPLGLYDPQDINNTIVHLQVETNLKNLPEDKQPDFKEKAADVFVRRLLKLVGTVVDNGCMVYLLFPEDYASSVENICGSGVSNQHKKIFNLLKTYIPGVDIFSNDRHGYIMGKHKYMFKNYQSDLCFEVSPEFGCYKASDENVETAFYESQSLFKFLPSEMKIRWEVGASDTLGFLRAVVFRWGNGSFILGPALDFELRVLKKTSPINDQMIPIAPIVNDAPASTKKPEPVRPLTGTVGIVPYASKLVLPDAERIKKWDLVMGWKDPNGRNKSFRNVTELAVTLNYYIDYTKKINTPKLLIQREGTSERQFSLENLTRLLDRKLNGLKDNQEIGDLIVFINNAKDIIGKLIKVQKS